MSDVDITARYAAPTASVALEPPRTQLWRRSLLLMLLFTLLSGGFYFQIWMLRRRHAFNAIESAHKISAWPSIAILVLAGVELALAVARGVTSPSVTEPGLYEGLTSYVRVGFGIVFIVQTFFVKSILEDLLAPDGPLGDEAKHYEGLSGMMTFFFSVFYLQYIINRDVIGAFAASGRPAPALRSA